MPTSDGGGRTQHRVRGVTLLELLIASSLTVLVATAVCSVYIYALRLWERGQAANATSMTATLAVDRIAKLAEQAVDAQVTSYGRLTVWLPEDRGPTGHYVPYWMSNSDLMYRLGDQITFYLSDSTGNSQAWDGDILWRRVNGAPDSSWSLLPGMDQGRVAPVKFLYFDVTTFDTRKRVQITVSTEQKYGNQVCSLTLNRYVYLRHHN